jgi:hypothetical protein
MAEATNVKLKTFRIGKAVFMSIVNANALRCACDLLSASTANKRVSLGIIKRLRAPVRLRLTPAMRFGSAKEPVRLFNLPQPLQCHDSTPVLQT